MSLTCGLVGLTACGKTTIYNAVTASGAVSYDGSERHRVIVNVPDPRIQALAKLYNPAKIVPATMQLVDIPGLATDSVTKPGQSTRLLKPVSYTHLRAHET